MDRRRMVGLSAMALLGLATGACVPSRRGPEPYSGLRLANARASEALVTHTLVGLRPFRPRGFRLEARRMGGKTLIHNYGHGGAGVSLAWGTGELAARKALTAGAREAAVIGAGAVGLATARELQRRGVDVTVYTQAVWPDPSVCSGVAPARFTPSYSVVEPEHRTPAFDRLYEEAAELSYRRWRELVGKGYGVEWTYRYSPRDEEPSASGPGAYSEHGVQERVVLRPGEHPFDRPYALRRVTLTVDTPVFLRAALEDFKRWGGRVEIRTFPHPGAVAALQERVVVNCAGLGARRVAGDETLTPIRGQLTALMPQPGVDYIVTGGGFSMVPRSNGLLLGGAPNERGNWAMDPDANAEREVLERAEEVLGGMRDVPRPGGPGTVASAPYPSPPPPAPEDVRFPASDLTTALAF